MKMMRCAAGHYFDNAKYPECPYCNNTATGVRTIPLETVIDDDISKNFDQNDFQIDLAVLKSFEPFWGKWIIKKEIGRGSTGQVFLLADTSEWSGESCALKVIRIPISEKMQFDNAALIPAVKHLVEASELIIGIGDFSHIVESFQYCYSRLDDESILFFLRLELLNPLTDLFNNLDVDTIIKIGADVCLALETLQQRQIIHRDIKAKNLFFTREKQFKLGDFEGIVTASDSGVYKDEFLFGTQGYIAPEVKYNHEYSFASDIFSLGILLNNLLFLLKSNYYSNNRYFNVNDEKYKGLLSVIRKATDFNANKRFTSAKDMRRSLSFYLNVAKASKTKLPTPNPPQKESDPVNSSDYPSTFHECSTISIEGQSSKEKLDIPGSKKTRDLNIAKRVLNVIVKCSEWLLFTCLLTLLPIIITLLINQFTNTAPFTTAYITEILFFSISVSIITLRNHNKYSLEMYPNRILEMVITFICVLIIVVSSVFYGIVVLSIYTIHLKSLDYDILLELSIKVAIGAATIGLGRQILEVE